jgi:hypothetical protein
MENMDIINLWKAQDEKLEKVLLINEKLLKEMTGQKAKSTLRSMIRYKIVGVITFVVYLTFLGFALHYAIVNYSSAWNYFIVSVAAITLINLRGFTDYIRHIVLASNINYNGSIMAIQEQLSKLQLSIIDHSKVMCLQFPFFTTFYLSSAWFPSQVGTSFIVLHVAFTAAFVFLTYWLYKNHKPENLSKKWFRNLIAGSGGKSVGRAIEFYQDLERFKEDE